MLVVTVRATVASTQGQRSGSDGRTGLSGPNLQIHQTPENDVVNVAQLAILGDRPAMRRALERSVPQNPLGNRPVTRQASMRQDAAIKMPHLYSR